MAGDNIIKGVIKIEAPGVQQTVSDVTQNLNTLSSNVGQAAEKVSGHMKKASLATFLARDAIMDIGHVARDLPYAANNFAILAGPIGKISTLMSTLTQETGSFRGAIGAMGGALSGGGGIVIGLELAISLLTLFGNKLFSGSEAAQTQADKLKEAKKALDEYVNSLGDVNQFQVKGAQSAQENLVQLQTLYKATQDVNIPLAERKKLVDELQEQYPKYFKNISDETILAGGATKAYEQLSAAILSAAKARAGQDALVDLQKQILALQQEQTDATEKEEDAYRNVQKLQKEIKDGAKQGLSGQGLAGLSQFLVDAQQRYNDKIKETTKLKTQELDLQKRSAAVQKAITDVVEADPESLLKPGGKEIKVPKIKLPKIEKLEAPVRTIEFTAPDRIDFNVPLYGYSDNPQLKKLIQEQLSQIKDAKVPVLPEFKDDGSWAKGFSKMLKDAEIRKALADLTKQLERTLESGLSNIGAGIGKSIGDAISGQGSFADAFKSVFSELGSLIEQLGEALIQYGIAKEVALKAITALGGGAAIAAGVGLVILGEVVKSSLSKPKKFAEGGFVPGTGDQDSVPALLMPGEFVIPKNLVQQTLATIRSLQSFKGLTSGLNSSFSPSVSGFNVSPMHVHVTGETRIQGDHIVTVFNKSNQKRGRSF